MTTTMEVVVTQLQQELFTLRAPSYCTIWICRNGLGRPKESCSKEEDFQQWSKKTETYFWSDHRVRHDVGVGS